MFFFRCWFLSDLLLEDSGSRESHQRITLSIRLTATYGDSKQQLTVEVSLLEWWELIVLSLVGIELYVSIACTSMELRQACRWSDVRKHWSNVILLKLRVHICYGKFSCHRYLHNNINKCVMEMRIKRMIINESRMSHWRLSICGRKKSYMSHRSPESLPQIKPQQNTGYIVWWK